jgi:hypothetical protein
VSPVRYELGFHISVDGILHSHRSEDLISYEIRYVTLQTIIYRCRVHVAIPSSRFYGGNISMLHSHIW